MNKIYCIIALLLLNSCVNTSNATKEEKEALRQGLYELNTIKLDSCEYYKWRTYYGYYSITHKGNCKNHGNK